MFKKMSRGAAKSNYNESAAVHPELLRKWRQSFNFMTAETNGVTSRENWDNIRQKFTTNMDIPAEKGNKIVDLFEWAWKTTHGDKKTLMVDEFLEDTSQLRLFRTGTKALTIMSFFSQMFHLIDFNDDGDIDFSEFLVFSKVCGFKDEATIKKAFEAIDANGNGTISEEEYVAAHVKYDLDAAVKMEDLPIYGLP